MSDSLTYTLDGSSLRVHLGEEIGLDFLSQVRGLLPDEKWASIHAVAFDFTKIRDLSSQELGALAAVLTDAFFDEKEFTLEAVPTNAAEQLRLVGLHSLAAEIRLRTDRDALPGGDGLPPPFAGKGEEAWPVPFAEIERYCQEAEMAKDVCRELQIENEELRKQLIHSEKVSVLGQMAGGVAHEFNNLIAIMSGYAELGLANLSDTQRLKEALEVVEESCTRAAAITEALLSFSRRKPPVKKTVDINELLQRQARLLASELMAYNVQIRTTFADQATTQGDPAQLEQVFMNLLTNALHAMPEGGTVALETMAAGDELVVQITDTGVGISDRDLPKIFAPFFTTKGALGGSHVKGTGLGLAVSQGIIESHQGKITVHSEKGKGTTFIITLPLCRAPAPEALPSPALAEQTGARARRVLTTLVVDDEERIRQILRLQLAEMGHIVLLAANGPEAIQICRESSPDIIFLDMLMPGMSGADALLEIRRLQPDVAVAVITGQAERPLEAMLGVMQSTGNIELIRKPFSLEEIREFVDRHLNMEEEGGRQ